MLTMHVAPLQLNLRVGLHVGAHSSRQQVAARSFNVFGIIAMLNISRDF
jgi:hypothetical protein